MMFFAKPGEYQPCSIYTLGHLILLVITIVCIGIAIYFTKTKDKQKIKIIIKKVTLIAWILEIIKIIFNIYIGNGSNPNTYIPLYFCSILLYAGIFSSFGKGKIKRIGDVFLETGAIIAGIIFLIFPTTSLPTYPLFHFMSIHSFAFHGIMIYLGIIMNMAEYEVVSLKDIKYYASLIISVSVIAYFVNIILDSNLMFISKDFPQNPISLIYRTTGKIYPLVMTVIQAFPPFYVIYFFVKKIRESTKKYC